MCTILNKIKQNKNNQQRELKINFPITRTVIVYEMEMKNKFVWFSQIGRAHV